MFERFSESARRVVFWARREAGRLAAEFIEPEHLLAGWVIEDQQDGSVDGERPHRIPGARPFLTAECARRLRAALAASAPHGTAMPESVDMAVSKSAKRVLTAAMQRASGTIGMLHLLWGLIIDEETSASRLLRENGVTAEQIAKAIEAGDIR